MPELAPTDSPKDSQHLRTQAMRQMFDRIAGRYDLMNKVLSLGMDRGWRKAAVSELQLSPNSVVADLACGTGKLSQEMQKAGLCPIGIDISEEMLRAADGRTRATSSEASNTILSDCLRLPLKDSSVQGVTCGFALRHFVEMRPLLEEATRILVPHGRLALLELDKPTSPLMSFGHNTYSKTFIPLAGRVLSEKSAYEFLPESLELLPAKEHLTATLESVGFYDIHHIPLSRGIAQLVSATLSASS